MQREHPPSGSELLFWFETLTSGFRVRDLLLNSLSVLRLRLDIKCAGKTVQLAHAVQRKNPGKVQYLKSLALHANGA